MLSRAHFWCILITALHCGSSFSFAGGLSLRQDSDFPYHIKADSLSYDDVTKTYMARGHVTITRGNQVLSADSVDLNVETMKAEAFGHVIFLSGEDRLKGERLEFDLEAGTGTLYEGSLFVKESNFYISGSKIERSGENSYHIVDGCFTTCDGDSPAWLMTAKDASVEVDGYGKLKHSTFRAKSIPILYAPYLVFPTSTKRKTGFLVPQYSQSNKKGSEYSQPFFWAIGGSCDATFYETYMSDRGFKHGIEFRYALSTQSKGAAMFDYLNDRRIDKGTGSGFQGYTGDDEDRTNKARWWFRAKANQDLVSGFRAKLDADVVSDQDYLREFKTGYSGYKETDDYFEKMFGRDLDDHTDTVRKNQLNLNRNWSQFSLNTDFRWYDNVIIRKDDDPDPTIQRLPHVQLDGTKQTLFNSPFYYDLESSADYFWRDYGTRGYRTEVHPRLYYPVRLLRYLDFEPSAGFRETVWYVEKYENEPEKENDRLFSREVADFRADLSTELTRIFHIQWKGFDRLRHAIRPQVVYEYVSVPSQSDLPNYDEMERLEDRNFITYSITNFFSARSVKEEDSDSGEQPDSTAAEPAPSYLYNDFCRIKLSQSYEIKEGKREWGNERRRSFSDMKGEIELRPHPCLNLDADATWSPYDADFTSYNALLTLCDKRGDHAWVDYRYNEGWSKSLRTKLLVRLFDPVSATWEYEHNLKDSKDVKTVYGLKYEHQCWSLAVSYSDDREIDEQKYFVEIGLRGLGEVGL